MPISRRLPRVNFYLLVNLFTAFLCGASLFVHADAFDDATKGSANGINNSLVPKQDEFLPVAEAYKVVGTIVDATPAKTLRLTWQIAPNYYLYKERFKFQATPNMPLNPVYSEGIAKFDEFAGKDMTIFHDTATVDFALPQQSPPFDLRITSQGCADAGLCYPPYTLTLHINPTTGESTPVANKVIQTNATSAAPTTATTEAKPLWVWQALLFALLGGMILNLMPCVFPVLSIKLMSLVQADSERLRLHGWAYTAGIVLCFVAFATVLLVAKSGGEAIGWGFQLQSPVLITALAYLFFTMGLSMSGLIHFGSSLMGAGQSLTQKSGLTGSFFTGVLAAIVASPCTAPFMGAALGFALTQPNIICLAVFAALGLGMALPLLLLCYLPTLAERLPKPGLWMETLKELLAFPLYLSAIWLLWVLTNQVGSNVMASVCIGAVAIAFACWINNRPSQSANSLGKKLIASLSIALALYLPYQMLQKTSETSRWQPYSPELLAELRQQGKPVFIDLTADWCITCLANERVTLSKKEVIDAFDAHQVATLKGDWTNRDPKISQLLEEYGRSGVPLYLWFPANRAGKADVLPQLLTPSLIIETIKAK